MKCEKRDDDRVKESCFEMEQLYEKASVDLGALDEYGRAVQTALDAGATVAEVQALERKLGIAYAKARTKAAESGEAVAAEAAVAVLP